LVNYTNLRFWRDYHNSGKFDLTDMTHPHMWYPKARVKKRNVYLHVGPTNSGKTYNALKRLEASSSGTVLIYLVILKEHELHVCGDPAAVPLIQRILEATGDVVTVQYYERLSPLVPLKSPLGSFSNIKAGDCLVTFSRRGIYTLKVGIVEMAVAALLYIMLLHIDDVNIKFHLPFLCCNFSCIQKRIEMEGKHLCSVVYGSLPPETRTKQATMFNDETSDLNVLVASDAIGMGLNLNISRIIFSTMMKFDGFCHRELTVAEIKQIAGRAGRYGSKFPVGEVTCLDAADLPLLHSSLKSTSPIIEERFLEKAKLSPDYFIAECEDMLKVAAIVDDLPLGLYDKYLFCISPVDMRDDISIQGLVQAGISILLFFLAIFLALCFFKELLELYLWPFFSGFLIAGIIRLIEEYLERSGWQPQRQRKFLHGPQKLLREYDVSQMYDIFNLQKCLVLVSTMSGVTARSVFYPK
ncbi:ATP-dependent RNA helicase SUV3, mitochondrial, partial [Dichanthelium oligosanthes]